jgi:hypothetical protein
MNLLDLTLKKSTQKEGYDGKVKKYTIHPSDLPAEFYAFSVWTDVSGAKSGSLSTLFAKNGQLYNELTDNGVRDSEYRTTILPRALRKHRHRS